MTLAVSRPHLRTLSETRAYLIAYYPNEEIIVQLDRNPNESDELLTDAAVSKALTIAHARSHTSIRILITRKSALILGKPTH